MATPGTFTDHRAPAPYFLANSPILISLHHHTPVYNSRISALHIGRLYQKPEPNHILQHYIGYYIVCCPTTSPSLNKFFRSRTLVKDSYHIRGIPNARTPGILGTHKLSHFLVLAKPIPNWPSLPCYHILDPNCSVGGILLDWRPC